MTAISQFGYRNNKQGKQIVIFSYYIMFNENTINNCDLIANFNFKFE